MSRVCSAAARASSTGLLRGPGPVAGASAQHGGGRLQQGVALAQHLVVVGAHPGPAGLARDEQLVEEPAPLRRVALDQGEVLGREQHGAQRAEHLSGPLHRRAAEPGTVGPAGVELELDQRLAPVAHDHAPDHRLAGAEPHQRLVGGHPVARERGEVADRLDQVGLALSVEPDQRRDPRTQRQLGALVAAEVRDVTGGGRTRAQGVRSGRRWTQYCVRRSRRCPTTARPWRLRAPWRPPWRRSWWAARPGGWSCGRP